MPKGKYSFIAGGKDNYALGTAGYVEGYENASIGNAAHAEGQETTAGGNHSHSQGLSTSANGECSHSEGYKTQAGVPVRPCTLTNLNANNQTVVITGFYNGEYSNDDRIFVLYLSNKKRHRVRRTIRNVNFNITRNETTFLISPPITGQPYSIKILNITKGRFSHAQGYQTTALGETSTAIGRNITVTGDTSVGIQLNKDQNNILSQNNTFAIIGGKVGINTLNPQKTLEVNGIVKIGDVEISPEGTLTGITKFSDSIEINDNVIKSNSNLTLSTNNEFFIESKKISLGTSTKIRSSNQHVEGSAFFASQGDAQCSKYFLIKQTSNSNLVTMTFDGRFENPQNVITIPKKSTWLFNISIVAYNVTNNDQGTFLLKGSLGNNGINTKFIGTPILERFFDPTMENAQARIDCSTGSLKVKVAGINNNIIKWHCVVSTNEICHEGFNL